ncbi:MAG: GNAT family N-acetyltransferase [Firmicutes bacterium]|nr:GNAT family N-acetyltransferase [Bacillota bacterium]
MKLFEEYPYLENEQILLRKMTMSDAPALQAFKDNKEVQQFLPTFLYEQKYEDAREVIRRVDEECFRTKETILLAVCCKQTEGTADDTCKQREGPLVGLAEIYHYEENKEKASIGCRLDSSVWGHGIGTRVIGLLRDYLIGDLGLRTVTAHVMRDNGPSARAAEKNGFVRKYSDIYEDWGFDEMAYMDKYVFKRAWLEHPEHAGLIPVQVEQFAMAYEADQDRIRAMLPDGFKSLRPVLRINTEIRDDRVVYAELNTPAEAEGRRGWLNIANWKSSSGDAIRFRRDGKTVTISAPFLELTYTGVGIRGGCPAEKDNQGCYYLGADTEFRPAEKIDQEKEFCDCSFAWRFHEGDAAGKSQGKTLPAAFQPLREEYPREELTAENAAKIPCRQVLGSYIVRFERYGRADEKL